MVAYNPTSIGSSRIHISLMIVRPTQPDDVERKQGGRVAMTVICTLNYYVISLNTEQT